MRELEFMGVSETNGYKYLAFLVGGEFALLIEKYEYFAYIDRLMELVLIETSNENAPSYTDVCIPDFEEVTEGIPEIKSEILQVNLEDNSTKKKTINVKWYEVFNLVDNLDLVTETQEI